MRERIPTPDDFEGVVEARARDAIETARDMLRRNQRMGEGITQLTEQIRDQYSNRFLVELLQNAHDAHEPDERSGRVEVLVDLAEGAHGVLYVANAGRPFSRANFDAMAELGISSKPPGEAIGNKGIGFTSVLQICERPEIYSAAPNSRDAGFTGYRFSFATDEELRELLGEDASDADEIRRNTPPFYLTVPLRDQPALLREFAEQGFSTVVRLPLVPLAAATVLAEIESLAKTDAPVMLFLERLAHLGTESRGHDNARRLELTRDAGGASWECSGGAKLRRVELSPGGTFLVARLTIPEEEVVEAINVDVAAHRIDGRWQQWSGGAAVSVAVLENASDAAAGRIYTFLPTRQAAPFPGHVNAPFYARIDRTGVDPDLRLNALFLDAAAVASAGAALTLVDRTPEEAGAAIDLLAWDPSEAERVRRGFDTCGSDVESAQVIATATGARRSLTDTRIWPAELDDPFNPELIERWSGQHVLSPGLGDERRKRLMAFSSAVVRRSMALDPDEVAKVAEAIARKAHADARGLGWWAKFYDLLAQTLGDEGGALAGRRILLGEGGKLLACGSQEEGGERMRARVFFHPRRPASDGEGDSEDPEGEEDEESLEDLTVPNSFGRRLAFMNADIPWRVRRAGASPINRPSRAFLESHDLVRDYELREVMRLLRDVVSRSRSERVHADALSFARRLEQRRKGGDQSVPLSAVGLRVPTSMGWVPADQALFSAAWATPLSEPLARLISGGQDTSPSIRELRDRLLAAPADWPFTVDPETWAPFLLAAGVRDGLWPAATPKRRTLLGSSLDREPERMLDEAVSTTVGETWRVVLNEQTRRPMMDGSPYEAQSQVFVLPGQDCHAELPLEARLALAELIVAGLDSWPDETLEVVFQRTDVVRADRLDRLTWPSPVAAFVERAPWVPVRSTGDDAPRFVHVADAWHHEETDEARPRPDYAPLVHSRVRVRLTSQERAITRLREWGLGLWHRPGDARRVLDQLGVLVRGGHVREGQVALVRKAAERAWDDLTELEPTDDDWTKPLLVTRAGRLDTVEPDPIQEPATVFVDDGGPRITSAVLYAAGKPMLPVDSAVGGRLALVLPPAAGLNIRRLSEVSVDVRIDGEPLPESASPDLLVAGERSWLESVVTLVLEARGGAFRPITQAVLERAAARLRSTTLFMAEEVKVLLDGVAHDLPPGIERVLAIPDEPALVLRRETREELTWRELARASAALADIIAQPQIADSLGLVFRTLGEPDEPASAPDPGDIAEALNLPPERLARIENDRLRSTSALVDRLSPVVLALEGREAHESFIAVAHDASSAEALAHALPSVGDDRSLLDLAQRAASVDELRRELGISLGRINDALATLGLTQIDYGQAHADELRAYVGERYEVIASRLRRAYLPEYEQRAALDGYVEAIGSLREIDPDPGWALEVDELDEEVLQERVDFWLEGRGVPRAAFPSGSPLPPLDETRRRNRDALEKGTEALARVVHAWCAKREARVPDPWGQPEFAARLWEQLVESGRMDFREIDESSIPRELASIGAWPSEMPQTGNATELGLSGEDLERGATEEEREQRRRVEERTTIVVDDQRFSAEDAGYRRIATTVEESLTPEVLSASKVPAQLDTGRDKRPSRDRGRAACGKPPGRRGRPTDTVLRAIGLVGEVVALGWIKHNYPSNGDECWRSSYRRHVLATDDPGDDSLGFDFEVRDGRQRLLFEAKAVVDDRLEIELGESEVRAAQAESRNDRYRIIHITNALEQDLRRVRVLPNPFSRNGRDAYTPVGKGLRLRFSPADESGAAP